MKNHLVSTTLAVSVMLCAVAPGEDLAPLTRKEERELRALEKERIALIARISAAYVRIGGGSGVAVTPDGLMITNHHVVGNQKQWQVSMPGGKVYEARVLGNDTRGDISVLRMTVPAGESVPFCPLADSDDVVIGEEVIALGNPFSFAWDASPTVSVGVVSALHRYQGGYSDAIQSDAPINPGNSGGPLLNLRGEVIGINGRVDTAFGGRWNTGIAFAIPANQIKRFLPAFEAANGGRVTHGRLDGLYGTLNEHNRGRGARIARIDSHSPAAAAGFKVGDLITAIDGTRITSYNRLLGVMGTYPVGSAVKVSVRRGSNDVVIDATIDRPGGEGAPPEGTAVLGIFADLEAEGAGVVIEDTIPGYGAEAAGLQVDDRITQVEGQNVANPTELATRLAALAEAGTRTVRLKVQREGTDLDLAVELRAYARTPAESAAPPTEGDK